VVLVIATQRPDKQSLPTGVSGNVSTRFCLKVTGQVENDMILGTSAYKNGLRSTTFARRSTPGSATWWVAGPAPQVVRTFYLNMPTPNGPPSAPGRSARPVGRSPGTRAAPKARARATSSPTSSRYSAPTPGCSG
jgi:hypothetical protein